MRNKMLDLHNHLFAQLERLGDEELSGEQLKLEIQRSKAIAEVASTVVDSMRNTVKVMEIMKDIGGDVDGIGRNIFHKPKELAPGSKKDSSENSWSIANT